MDLIIDKIIELDTLRREAMNESETLKAQQNRTSKKIPGIKKDGGDVSSIMEEMKKISQEVAKITLKLSEIEEEQIKLGYMLPNILHNSVPDGKDDVDNVEIRRWGEPKKFLYNPKAHWDIGTDLEILDPQRAVKVTGSRFHFYVGMGARLERSIINYFLNTHTDNGYTEMLPPFIANSDSMRGTGQLPKFVDDMYKLEGEDYFLIPTAEVPVTNFHRDEILMASKLPLKYCAYSPCFRNEEGAAGRDTRGLIRQHQFNKVELVEFVEPEKSYEELEHLVKESEKVLEGLGLPYRVVNLCSGDIGFSSAKTYDIEVWMPSYNRYVEIASCSNYEDFQARRLSCRFKRQKGDKAQLLHTLNGSGVAVGRTVAAILENYQNDNGTVTVPEALRVMMGTDVIGKRL